MTSSYSITFTAEAIRHLEAFRRHERVRLLDGIRTQLQHQPGVPTRSRKAMRANPLSDWELRVGRFRVFYEVDEGLRSVRVLAVGEKRRERLVIGGREFKL